MNDFSFLSGRVYFAVPPNFVLFIKYLQISRFGSVLNRIMVGSHNNLYIS